MADEPAQNEEEDIEPSSLDDLTHAEYLVLYQGCQDNIRFAKAIQWKTVAWTVLLFALLMLACHFLNRDEVFVKTVIVLSIVFAMAAIYTVSIYQSWQGTEREKVRMMISRFSSVTARIHRVKSRVEANIHRFTLYGFMVLVIVAANYLTVAMLMRLYPR